jgi:hypothetical protein
MKKKRPPYVVTPNSFVIDLSIPPPQRVAGWPRSEEPPRRIRAAQSAHGDFSQLSYLGVPTDVALQRVAHQPDRTAVDDIRDALQRRDRRPLLLAAKLYPYANLAANADFVAVMQDLQTSARAGDQWAKATLKAFGEALGAVGQGQTATAPKEEQHQRRRAQTARAIAIHRHQPCLKVGHTLRPTPRLVPATQRP